MTHSLWTRTDSSPETPEALTFDVQAYRQVMGSFPTGVSIITTRDGAGEPVGITCNSFSSVSLDPPLVLWCMRKASKSIDIFKATKSFAISVLAQDQDHLSQRFATSSIEKKFESIGWMSGYSDLPLIDDCVARFQCSVYQTHDAGDHIIFVGKVEQFEMVSEEDSLVYYKGAYMSLVKSTRLGR
jgi:flavin reductase (DIM6/NTAB) family NADH-FMN oxidoreductase RutF